MAVFCVDTNIFVEAKNGPYGFDIVPTFWDFIDGQMRGGNICSSLLVYDELLKINDELSEWIKHHKEFFLEPNKDIQGQYRLIADYINGNNHYPLAQKALFLGNADPWVIAQAKVHGSIVVTHEKIVDGNSKKIKIPNVCIAHGVKHVDLYKMLRDLNARF